MKEQAREEADRQEARVSHRVRETCSGVKRM